MQMYVPQGMNAATFPPMTTAQRPATSAAVVTEDCAPLRTGPSEPMIQGKHQNRVKRQVSDEEQVRAATSREPA